MAKAAFSLSQDVLDAIRRAVAEGRAESASAFVEMAVRAELHRSRREALRRAYEDAARHDAFQADMRAVADEFAASDTDGLATHER